MPLEVEVTDKNKKWVVTYLGPSMCVSPCSEDRRAPVPPREADCVGVFKASVSYSNNISRMELIMHLPLDYGEF